MTTEIPDHKRAGLYAIIVSIIAIASVIVFSENYCGAESLHNNSVFQWLLTCLYIDVYEELPGAFDGIKIQPPAKYFLLACLAPLSVGILWYLNALQLPRILQRREK